MGRVCVCHRTRGEETRRASEEEVDGSPLRPPAAEHTMLEGHFVDGIVVDDVLDADEVPEDAVARVLKHPRYLALDEIGGDLGANFVDLVGGLYALVLVRKTCG